MSRRSPRAATGAWPCAPTEPSGPGALTLQRAGAQVPDVSDSDVPVQVAGSSGITQIAAGASFKGIAVQTTVKASGSCGTRCGPGGGNLGPGRQRPADGPLLVRRGHQSLPGHRIPARAAIAGRHYSAMMVGTDGSVLGWGQDLFGNLGVGSGHRHPLQPHPDAESGQRRPSRSPPATTTCSGFAPTAPSSPGADNSNGQLGDGTTNTSVTRRSGPSTSSRASPSGPRTPARPDPGSFATAPRR